MQRASQGATGEETLPRAWLRGSHDFSFSGLKTPFCTRPGRRDYTLRMRTPARTLNLVRELAAAFQLSVADVMTTKTLNAARKHNVRGIMLGGGVAANSCSGLC